MKKIKFLVLSILIFASVLIQAQTTGKILIMKKDTSKFLNNTNAQKNTIVSWSDTTVVGANIQYLLYCNMLGTQSIRDAINNGCAKIYGGSGGGGTTNHALLTNLSYTGSGHTGFQPTKANDSIYFTFTERNKLNGLSNLDTTNIYYVLGLKLNTIDTANMLLPYFRKSDTTYWNTKLGLKLDTANFTATTIKNKLGISILSGDNTGDTVGHGILVFNTSLKQNRADTNTIGNPITLSYFNSNSSATDSAYIKKVVNDTAKVMTLQRVSDNGKTTTNVLSSNVTIAQINGNGGKTLVTKDYSDSTKVPYNSAYSNVNLGTYNYIGNSFIGNQTPTTPTLARQVYWNDTDKTYSINADTVNGVTIDIAHEQFIRVVNKTGSQINDGQVVYLSGSQGNRPKAWLARADLYTTSRVIGIATQNIAINAEGSVCISGVVHGYNTSAFNDSADLYLSSTVYGKLTDTIPSSPNHVCYVGKTLNSTSNGSILVAPKNVICSDTLFTDNSNAEAPTQRAVKIAVGSKLDSMLFYNQDTLVKDPTGFINNDNIKLHYDTTNRTITLSGAFEAYWQGRKIAVLTNGWTSAAHGTTLNKTYYLYYNGTNFIFDTIQYRFRDLQIAYVWYSAANKIGYNELHGCSMDWQSHELFHRTIGTTLVSGADISGVTLNSTTATNRRPVISAALIEDEDLEVTDSAFASKSYCIRYLTGTGATRTFTMDYAEIIPVLSTNPYYNSNTGGTWGQTLFPANAYGAIFIMAVPTSNDGNSQRYRFEFVQPQTVSNTLLTIQNLTTTSLNMGSNSSEEYIFVGKIIVKYVGPATNDWTIISTEKLTGSKIIQTSATAAPYSATTDTTLTGNGTPTNPLSAQEALNLKVNNTSYVADTIKSKLGITTLSGVNTGDTVGHGVLAYNTTLKLNISDTATMLSPYLRKGDTTSLSNRINLKLNQSDTTSLSNRINLKLSSSDTTSLSNRINTKLAITDTTVMLSPYLRKVDTASLSNRIDLKLNKTDTASLSNRINLKLNQSDTLSLSNRINTKLAQADTVSLSNRINTKVPTSTTISINGTTQDLSANRSWTVTGSGGADTTARRGTIGCNVDGMGSVCTTGLINYMVIPYDCTITGWSIVADGTSPTCTFDVWKKASGTSLPTVADSLINRGTGARPALTTGNVLQSTTLTGWTTTVNAGDIIGFNLDACLVATKLRFTLNILKQ